MKLKQISLLYILASLTANYRLRQRGELGDDQILCNRPSLGIDDEIDDPDSEGKRIIISQRCDSTPVYCCSAENLEWVLNQGKAANIANSELRESLGEAIDKIRAKKSIIFEQLSRSDIDQIREDLAEYDIEDGEITNELFDSSINFFEIAMQEYFNLENELRHHYDCFQCDSRMVWSVESDANRYLWMFELFISFDTIKKRLDQHSKYLTMQINNLKIHSLASSFINTKSRITKIANVANLLNILTQEQMDIYDCRNLEEEEYKSIDSCMKLMKKIVHLNDPSVVHRRVIEIIRLADRVEMISDIKKKISKSMAKKGIRGDKVEGSESQEDSDEEIAEDFIVLFGFNIQRDKLVIVAGVVSGLIVVCIVVSCVLNKK